MCLLKELILVSEKAANIARRCRADVHLFNLLVERKAQDESNPRFVEDFKTLADVLIQETVKYFVGLKFPVLKEHIKGEESNTFTGKNGESVTVELTCVLEDTRSLLEVVLNGDAEAAKLLSQEVHRDVQFSDVTTDALGSHGVNIDVASLGVWIDPIDSTSEYINAIETGEDNGLFFTGLRCVTVLIGVYDRNTGTPIMGIINRPFHEEAEDKWVGRCYWGPSTVPSPPLSPTNIICVSSSEDPNVKSKLTKAGFVLREVSGAGYKILTVITGLADGYVLSKSSTFKWDTCGPQAILRGQGGDVIKFEGVVRGEIIPLDYKDEQNASQKATKINKYCNYGGVIAYGNKNILERILGAFS